MGTQLWCGLLGSDLLAQTKFFSSADKLGDKLPIVVAVSDQSVGLMKLASTERFHHQLGIKSNLEYIPMSKGRWPYEGIKQRKKICNLLAEVLMQAYGLPSPAWNP